MIGEGIRKLGFGLMRLPQKDGKIDLDEAAQMVDLFLEAGFTYFDTAWAYAGSEEATRRILVERYPRESYQLATKNAAWLNCKSREEALAQFDTSLARTGAGYFDYYLLQNLGLVRTKCFDDYGMWDWIREKKEQGLIRHMGFSFHSTPEELEEILEAHPEMEFVQLQINYADWENPSIQSRRCYEVARAHGKPVIVMEPVKGGMLANPPEPVREIFKEADPDASCASWGIRFAASLDGVLTVLSGMSSVAQMRDNLSYMKDFAGMGEKEKETIRKAQAAIQAIPLIPCTSCNYCAKVCPKDIGISETFTAMNYNTLYGKEAAVRQMGWLSDRNARKTPDRCVKCGKCEQACPQHIKIREELEKAAAVLLPAVP